MILEFSNSWKRSEDYNLKIFTKQTWLVNKLVNAQQSVSARRFAKFLPKNFYKPNVVYHSTQNQKREHIFSSFGTTVPACQSIV